MNDEATHLSQMTYVPHPPATHQPPVSGNHLFHSHGSLRSTRTPQRSSGAPSTAFGGPTLCNHGSQRSTTSGQRSSRAPSTLVESPLPTSYLSTSLPSVYVPSPLMHDLSLFSQSSAPLDSSSTCVGPLKPTTTPAVPLTLPKHVTTDQILRNDKRSQLEDIRSAGWCCCSQGRSRPY